MSFTPKIEAEKLDELYRLYLAAFNQVSSTPKQDRAFQIQWRDELQNIWDSFDPKPMPLTFDDFRRLMADQFLERLRKADPRYPSV
jgi:hypothetical protein